MPHPPQLFGSSAGFTHFAPQQSRAGPHAASHPAPPELPLPELALPELLPPELFPLEPPLLEPPEPPPLELPPLEPLPLPELLPEPSTEASSPGCGTNSAPPQ
jgi:hypothetical protein